MHRHTRAHTHVDACVENFVMWQMQLKCLQAFCRFMARLVGKIPSSPHYLSPIVTCCLPLRLPHTRLPLAVACNILFLVALQSGKNFAI